MKDSLLWWGVSSIKGYSFKLMSDIHWDKIPEKKREQMTAKLVNAARKIQEVDFTRPARTGLITKFKFYAVRMMQTGLGKDDPEYTEV